MKKIATEAQSIQEAREVLKELASMNKDDDHCDDSSAGALTALHERRWPQNDFEALENENAKLKEILRWIAYPDRGSVHENMNIYETVKLIQDNFTLEELEC